MKIIYLLLLLFSIQACNKPHTVLICGDHVCINNDEAEQYFEENLSIEVKVLKNKKETSYDLVKLNLSNNKQNKTINVFKKENNKNKIKTLSSKEISKLKSKLKEKNITKKNKNKELTKNINTAKDIEKKFDNKKRQKETKIIYKKRLNKNEVDVCKIIEKCNIENISKYLIQKSKTKKFPDITIRE